MSPELGSRLWVALLALGALAFAPPNSDVRHLIHAAPSDSHPVWVPAELVSDADGSIRWDRFPRGYQADLLSYVDKLRDRPLRSVTASECDLEVMPLAYLRQDPRPNATLRDLVRHSEGIYLGRVTDVVSGLYNGVLASLASVTVEHSYRHSALAPDSSIRVLVQSGTLTLQGRTVCKKKERVPSVGDELVVFYPTDAAADPTRIISPLDAELFVRRRDGTTSLPTAMQDHAGDDYSLPFDQLLKRISRLVAKQVAE